MTLDGALSHRRVLAPLALALLLPAGTIAESARPEDGAEGSETEVGATLGRFAVAADGAATYTVELRTPPGTSGLDPNLSLAYDSQSGNGSIGVGFSLEGLSLIERCPASYEQDGFACGIHYDANDRFCLDGQRLVRVDAQADPGGSCLMPDTSETPYFVDGAVYHTEKESWRRIVAQGTCGNGPCGFTVTTRSGVTKTYGGPAVDADGDVSTGSRIWGVDPDGDALGVRVWALDGVEDLDGNRMTPSYTQAPLSEGDGSCSAPSYPCGPDASGAGDPASGSYSPDATSEYYLCRIDYTSNDGTSPGACGAGAADPLQAQRFVVFGYENRGNDDVLLSFKGSAQVTARARMVAIQTRLSADASLADSAEVASYAICYDDGDDDDRTTMRSRVVSISECGSDGTCYDGPTTFSWLPTSFGLDELWTADDLDCADNFAWIDYNGDGMSDWSCTDGEDGAAEVWVSTGTSLTTTGQVAGDSYLDGAVPCTGSGEARVDWADFDGDGRDDWLCYSYDLDDDAPTNQSIRVLLSSDEGLVENDITASPSCTASWDWSDFNADGKTDWVCWDSTEDNSVSVLLAVADGGTYGLEQPAGAAEDGSIYSGESANCTGDNVVTWADVNADGLEDWVCYDADSGTPDITTLLSTGSSLTEGPQVTGTTTGSGCGPCSAEVFWTDFNGDGASDWLCSCVDGDTGLGVRLSTGAGFFDPATMTSSAWPTAAPGCDSSAGMQTDWVDFNGDGTSDWVCSGGTAVEVLASVGSDLVPIVTSGAGDTPSLDLGTSCDVSSQQLGWPDATGDGLSDWVCADTDSGSLAVWAHPPGSTISGSTANFSDLVATVATGLGETIALTYAPLTEGSVYTASQSGVEATNAPRLLNGLANDGYPVEDASASMYAVAAYERSDGRGNTYRYDYAYDTALIDLDGRGWLGFSSVTRTDEQLQTETETTYNQTFPFDGTIRSSEVRGCGRTGDELGCGGKACERRVRLTAGESDWCCQGAGDDASACTTNLCCAAGDDSCSDASIFSPYPGVYQVLQLTGRSDTYDYGRYLFSLGNQYAYDDYGNRAESTNWGYVDRAYSSAALDEGDDEWNLTTDDDVHIAVDWYNATEDAAGAVWLVGYATEHTTSSDAAGNDVLRRSRRQYDYPAGSQPDGWNACGSSCETSGTMHVVCRGDWRNAAGGACGEDDLWLDETATFDGYGNRDSATDSGGHTVTFDYDDTYATFVELVTMPPNERGESLARAFTYDAASGRRIVDTDFNGNSTIICLDAFGRAATRQGPIPEDLEGSVTADPNCLPSSVDASSNVVADLATVSWGRDSDGGLYRQVDRRMSWQDSIADDNRSDARHYDGLRRVYQSVSAGSDSDTVVQTTSWFSENLWNQRTVPAYDDATTVYEIERCHDSAGRLTRETRPYLDDATTSVTTWDYSGIPAAAESDGLGRIVTERVEAAGTSTAFARRFEYAWLDGKKVLAATADPADSGATTGYAYDRLARRTEVVDPIGATTKAEWNSLDQKIALSDSDRGTHRRCHNDDRRLASKTDGLGQKALLRYDALHRQAGEDMMGSDGVEKRVTYAYDLEDVPNALGPVGRIAVDDLEDACGDSTYEIRYDEYGRIRRRTLRAADPGDASCATVATWGSDRQRDPQGRTVSYLFPDGGMTLSRVYAPLGWLTRQAISDDSGDELLAIAYEDHTAIGRPQTIQYGVEGSGSYPATETLSYYPLGELATQQVVGAGGAQLVDESYTWDRLWNLTEKTSTVSGADDQYGYGVDGVESRRLTSDPAATYGYDAGGNLTAVGDVTYSYNDATHQVAAASDGSFLATYDANGSVATRTDGAGEAWTYSFDVDNRLVAASSDSAAVELAYDDHGRRIRKAVNDGPVTLYATRTYEQELDAGATSTSWYLVDSRGRVAALESSGDGSDPQPSYFPLDEIRNVVAAIDGDGNQTASVDYTSWGAIGGDSDNADSLRYTFGNHELDQETGLYHMGRRYYDPQVGRFLSADAGLGGRGGEQDVRNRYAYAVNSPLAYADPSGASVWSWVKHHAAEVAIVTGVVVATAVVAGVGVACSVATDGGCTGFAAEADVEMVELDTTVIAEETAAEAGSAAAADAGAEGASTSAEVSAASSSTESAAGSAAESAGSEGVSDVTDEMADTAADSADAASENGSTVSTTSEADQVSAASGDDAAENVGAEGDATSAELASDSDGIGSDADDLSDGDEPGDSDDSTASGPDSASNAGNAGSSTSSNGFWTDARVETAVKAGFWTGATGGSIAVDIVLACALAHDHCGW